MARDAVPLIALLTDFGASEYVGVVKGVIASRWPGGTVVDLCHSVRPQAVREGAWVLWSAYRHFPPGTIFLAVVDPGVGTRRAAVAVQSRRYRWVGPDNGLLYPAASEDGVVEAVRLPIPPGASPTFHARDVFAPAAARWAAGGSLGQLGVPHGALVPLSFYRSGEEGEVVRVDPFGNLVTTIPLPEGWSPPAPVEVAVAGRAAVPATLVRTYGDADTGELVVVEGSSGTLEVSVVAGSAQDRLGVQPGDRLAIRQITERRGVRG